MVKVHIIQGNQQQNIETSCKTVLQLLQQQQIEISAVCGGNGTCGKCKVNVDGVIVSSCKTDCRDGMTIYLPEKESIETPSDSAISVAIDLGTTTIALAIYQDGQAPINRTINNPLSSFGSDVISRVQQIQKDSSSLSLQQSILCKRIYETISGYGIAKEMVVAGNTIMQHIFAGISPIDIAVYPFTAPTLFKEKRNYDLPYFKECNVIFLPCVASYVGGDIIAGLLDCQMYKQKGNTLFIDIGTNGEIVLKKNEKLICCSVAAGPAFEGAQLSCGSNDITKCITHFSFADELVYDNEKAVGISGSGYLDLLALLFHCGILEETGRLLEKDEVEDGYRKYMDEDENGSPIFRINESLYIDNKDIRNLQMAISATSAAIATILTEAKMNAEDISKVYISGNFGHNLSMDSIIAIGLIPKSFKGKEILLKNSSLEGAIKLLEEQRLYSDAVELSNHIQYIELSNSALFKEAYLEHMYFVEDKVWNYNSH